MTAVHPIGAGNAREAAEFAAEVDSAVGIEDASLELVEERATLAERLAELDYALTGTACYSLTWPERLERIERLQSLARAAGSLLGSRAKRGGR